jgi:preprotein translocase subunit SecE
LQNVCFGWAYLAGDRKRRLLPGPEKKNETRVMKKSKTTKPKGGAKEGGQISSKGQVIKLKPAKPRVPWTSKLPPVRQYWASSVQFVKEAWQELKKTNWPNRKETLGGTGVVMILVILVAIFLGFIDFGLSRLVKQIIY